MNLWWSQTQRHDFPPSDLHQRWDVVIVGGGFSGLWSAHHLIAKNPKLTIAILEKDHVGSGASGRNGGWVSALYPISDRKLAKDHSQESIDLLHANLRSSIDEIGIFISHHNIKAGFLKGGSLTIARNPGQIARLQKGSAEIFLSSAETLSRINFAGALGSTFTPDCARINPAQLVVGLAKSLSERGVSIFENTTATISQGRKVCVNGQEVESNFVIRATEAYHSQTRNEIPIYSLIVATNPLPDSAMSEIGIANHETFAEASHLITYGQRTLDNRLLIGGRGAPYTWGSKRNDAMERDGKSHNRLRELAKGWFPVLKNVDFPFAWGGAVAVTRDWSPYLRYESGYAEMGGYVGDGVTLSYLAAKTLSEIISESHSELQTLPFVQKKNSQWEIEPLRWLGVNGAIKIASLADREEAFANRPSKIAKLFSPIFGK